MRIFFSKSALLALALAFTEPLVAQDDECLADAKASAEGVSGGALTAADCLDEVLDPLSPVSGSAGSRIRGLMSSDMFERGHRPDTHAFEAYISRPCRLHVRYLSDDGSYEGSQNFIVRRAGWVRLPFDTRYGRQLAELGPEGLSVHAETASDCWESKTPHLAPVRGVNSDDEGFRTFTLLALIEKGDNAGLTIVHADKSGEGTLVRCEPIINDATAVSFNTACTLTEAAFESGARTVLDIRSVAREIVPLPTITP